ncbi:MAG: TetR/AcrR family transcriptional regulator [Streptomycetaceae bacterium]|nr:TetR/AcrR family transcriptional regulator [Streptomycetaceae bacterium]
MTATRTARDRARAQLSHEIKEAARRQVAVEGAQSLSLRAIARELGMVSSALYRYFPSRDELLTQLIIDAYDGIGAAVEQAAAPLEADPRAAWQAQCAAARDWAKSRRHEYALIYGTPVPGYEAPEDTVGPASRIPVALLRTMHIAHELGMLAVPGDTLSAELAAQARTVSELTGVDLPPSATVRAVIAWSQLSGMIGFELFGTFAGSMDPADAFFTEAVAQMADFIGLVPGSPPA